MENSGVQLHQLRNLFCLGFISISALSFGQVTKAGEDIYTTPIPKNIEQCFDMLNKTMSRHEVELIKDLPEDSIYSNKELKEGTDFFHAWKIYQGSPLTKYFHKKGLYGSYEIYETILTSYHRHLNANEIGLETQIQRHQAEQKANSEIFLSRLNRDFLNGFYIPQNMEECMTELDKIMDQEAKNTFKDQEESKAVALAFRFNPGLWIRNNWGLWGGSRLQTYFFDQGVKDSEAICWMILTSYYRHVNDKPIEFEKQITANSERLK